MSREGFYLAASGRRHGRITRHLYNDPAPSAAHKVGVLTDSSRETPVTSREGGASSILTG
jgi:hypothetical protein